MGNSSSHSAALSGVQSLGVSGKVSASAQSGRASQNFAAVVGALVRAYEDGEFSLQEIKKAFESLSVALDEHPPLCSSVDRSFIDQLEDWKKGNENLLPLVRLAVYSSREVYNLRTKQAIDSKRLRSLQFADSELTLLKAEPATVLNGKPESYLENTKNWALFRDSNNGDLYFSVRGTSTSGISAVIDNLTNLDAQETDVFNTEKENQGTFRAHRGFLQVAESMFQEAKSAVLKAAKGLNLKPNLTFCGHSAGGGTAFYLYHYFQVHASDAELSDFKNIHCITFGSAAIVSIPNPIHSSRQNDRVVSFINHDDPVPRLDLPYATWVAGTVGRYLAIQASRPNVPPYSALPIQSLYPGGELVLLVEEDGMKKLDPNVLSDHAFLELGAHDSREYVRLIKELGW
ncbi:Alpha/Beta hydrolase protein [Collybia nuda]|uniref:sn-1-specific diacylglycerol lipase n=1 Tax=Collybia nuda TaxID=64659 RepID=A0A9P6CH69_9AGAR|nr:Alpha/Beta hydrolase protein [Collybia nuda]